MNTIDELMDRDPNTLSANEIDEIIAYHRKFRAQIEGGFKPKKDAPKIKLDMAQIVANLAPAKPTQGKIRRI